MSSYLQNNAMCDFLLLLPFRQQYWGHHLTQGVAVAIFALWAKKRLCTLAIRTAHKSHIA